MTTTTDPMEMTDNVVPIPAGRNKGKYVKSDHCTFAGSNALAKRIQNRWWAHGHTDVKVWVVNARGIYWVRSNLVDGMPPSHLEAGVGE
jgi:chitodextrinase